MSELEANNRLVFHGAGYDALIPGGTQIPGGVVVCRQANIMRESDLGCAVVLPRAGASMPDTGLYAATAAALCERPVYVSTDLERIMIDPCEEVPPPGLGERVTLMRRFNRVTTIMLEQQLSRPIESVDRVRVGALAMQFMRRYRNAQAWQAKGYRETLRSGEQFPL